MFVRTKRFYMQFCAGYILYTIVYGGIAGRKIIMKVQGKNERGEGKKKKIHQKRGKMQ